MNNINILDYGSTSKPSSNLNYKPNYSKSLQNMQPFTATQQFNQITQHFASINNPNVSLNTYEQNLIETIINNQNFDNIAQNLSAIESYYGELLSNADLSLVQLRTQEIQYDKENRQRYVDKLKTSIQKLQTSIGMVEDYHSTAISKLNWLATQTHMIQQEREEIEEEIQIISSQNNSKPEVKKVKPAGNNDLAEILKLYECPNGFPRNKTEVLMLINRIQARIQHLQMNKLKTYETQP